VDSSLEHPASSRATTLSMEFATLEWDLSRSSRSALPAKTLSKEASWTGIGHEP
jgi:hypothetical protein